MKQKKNNKMYKREKFTSIDETEEKKEFSAAKEKEKAAQNEEESNKEGAEKGEIDTGKAADKDVKGEMTLEQKIFMYLSMTFSAISPLLLYAFIPSLCLTIGYVVGYEKTMTMEEFFSYGANFYSALGIILVLVIFSKRAKKRGSTLSKEATLFFNEMKPLKAIGFFIFGFASATAVSALLTLLPRFFLTENYTGATRSMYLGRDFVFTSLTLLFTAPVAEEIIFRGYMLNTFLEKLEEKKAIIITSIIFAIMHGNFVWILYSFFLGYILAKTSMKEDNIAYGVLLHIGFNATSIVNLLITENKEASDLLYASKWLILIYGLTATAISIFLANIYTGKVKLNVLKS